MNKIPSLVFILLAFVSANLWAGGPWLVYSTKESGTEKSLLLINLEQAQYAFTENDSDNDTWIHYNPKTKVVFRKIYADNNNDVHRLSWGRSQKTFFVAYSQYGPLNSDGISDLGVWVGTGSLVSWPNRGKSIGITGKYPSTLKFTTLRIDAGWSGDRLNNGTRGAYLANWTGTLETTLTAALNAAAEDLVSNQDAKNWIIVYFTDPARGWYYTQTADVEE
jgi:hypothetical protein